MLCYQSSRDATEVIQHTFSWIASNIKALMLPALPLLCVAALLAIISNGDTPIFTKEFLWGADYMALLRPFTLTASIDQHDAVSIVYAVAAFAATVLYAPLLIRYFKERRSLTDLSFSQYAKILKQHLRPALIAGAVMGVVMFVAVQLPSYFFVAILLVTLPYFIPNILLVAPMRRPMEGTWWMQIKSLLWLLLSFVIVQLLPFCLNLAALLVYSMLTSLVPDLFSSSYEFDLILSALMVAIIIISFCWAVVAFIIGSLLFHGAIYPLEQN